MDGFSDGGWQFLTFGVCHEMELPIFNTYMMNFSHHHFCCFTIVPLFVWNKSTAWNRCLQHPCFKNLCKIAQASKNSDSNARHFLSDLLTHSWFHSMLFTLPGFQFPYIVMNRCLYISLVTEGERYCRLGFRKLWDLELQMISIKIFIINSGLDNLSKWIPQFRMNWMYVLSTIWVGNPKLLTEIWTVSRHNYDVLVLKCMHQLGQTFECGA